MATIDEIKRAMQLDLIRQARDANTPPDSGSLEGRIAAQALRDADMVPTGGEGPAPQPQERGAFDRTGDALSEGLGMAGNFAKSLVGGESPTANAIPESVPLYSAEGVQIPIPEWARQTVGRVGDVLMVPLSVATAAMGGVAGAVGDVADLAGMKPENADRLTRDVNALPEAMAGMPNIAGAGSSALRRISRAVPDTPNARPVRPAAGAVPPPARQTAGPAFTAPATSTALPPMAAPMPSAPLPMATGPEIGVMARQASANPTGKKAATLAENMAINADDLAAAERAGIDLPPDVFSDNVSVREAAGMTRAQVGSDASAQWVAAARNAQDQATTAMADLGATPDLSVVSQSVRNSLNSAMDGLKTQSNVIYNRVNDAVPNSSEVDLQVTRQLLTKTVDDLGGVDGLSPLESEVFRLVSGEKPVTYARLNRLRTDIGSAASNSGPYKDVNSKVLDDMYAALNDDQIANVARLSGDDLAEQLRTARSLVSERKTMEQGVVQAFGRDLEGSIATKLRTAITGAKKGDDGGLNRMMNVIPENLRREAIMTGISAVVQSNRATEPGFGFPEYAKFMDGLTNNSVVADRIKLEVGPATWKMMNDLATVSRRITEAKANVLTTGKSNQAILNAIVAETALGKVMQSTAGARAVRGAAVSGGGLAGGPAGAVGGNMAVDLLGAAMKTPAQRQAAVGALFADPAFQRMVLDVTKNGNATPEVMAAVTRSPAYKRWATASGIANPETWVAAAILGSVQGNQESANPEENAQSGQP